MAQESLTNTNGDAKPRRKASGRVTSDLIVSSYVANNAEVFPNILDLYVPDGSRIADVTYGTGVFWRNVDTTRFELLPSDIKTGIDCTDLPYPDEYLDALVLDPPYMEGFYRRSKDHLAGGGNFSAFRSYYSDGKETSGNNLPKWHDAVLDVYYRAGDEAFRTLKDKGIFIIKCQDEVSANKQHLTHVELITYYQSLGFAPEDIFIVMRQNKPAVSRIKKQVHARKNHSYFLVMRKLSKKNRIKMGLGQ